MTTICLNEDSNNFVCSFPTSEMTVEGLKKQAQAYATGQVSRVLFNVNAQRACFPSTTMEPIWKGAVFHEDGTITYEGKPLAPDSMVSTVKHLKLMFDQGIDPYAIWLEETRRLKREAWVSIRMNDMHAALDENSIMHDSFWRYHREFRISTYDIKSWPGQGYDYAHPEVRKYQLAVLQEVLERYDSDGVELDWSRFPQYLRAGFELLDAHFLTDFMRKAKALIGEAARRRGHPIRIGVRLPSRPELARRHGFELGVLRDEHLADVVVVTNFFPNTDHDMPMELWREILGKEIELDAGLELGLRTNNHSPFMLGTLETFLGYACEYLHRGADAIYLFNCMRGLTGIQDDAALQQLLSVAGDAKTAYSMKRRHVVSYCTTNYVTIDTKAVLPLDIDDYSYAQIRIHVGGGTVGRNATILLGFQENDGKPPLDIRLNGVPCEETEPPPRVVRGKGTLDMETMSRTDKTASLQDNLLAMPEYVIACRYFQIPAGVLHDGENAIQLLVKKAQTAKVIWAEIDLL